MHVYDPLYGRFEVPGDLAELMLIAEVQRLAEIRLVNSPSPSMAALGEIRRYSHTLGVLFLAGLLPRGSFSPSEWQAFQAAVLLHDVGTPPFAHLFEYHLREHDPSWDHERMASRVPIGAHAPENTAQQIHAGRAPGFLKTAAKHGVSRGLVDAILRGEHALGILLKGTIDIDNLDNVARMAWALGLERDTSFARDIAAHLGVASTGALVLPRALRAPVTEWLRLRNAVYHAMNLNATAMALQAALSDAIGRAIAAGELTAEDWTLTDDALVDRLQKCRALKDDFVKDFRTRPLESAFRLRLRGTLKDLGFGDRAAATAVVEAVLKEVFPDARSLGYVLIDRTTFGRRLAFVDPDGRPWHEGEDTRSVILFGFVRSTRPLPEPECHAAAERLLQRIPGGSDTLIEGYVGAKDSAPALQRSFAFPSHGS